MGYISVIEILSMVRGEVGFRDGVKEVCPDCEVFVTYTGDFTDIGLGKEAELALLPVVSMLHFFMRTLQD